MKIRRSDPLRVQVYDYLRVQMNSGNIKPGDFINQAELMETLQVSRSPLRDSMMQLEAEGFVSIIPCKGVKISELTLDVVRHIYEIAGALEAAAFESVFPLVDSKVLDELERITGLTQDAMKSGDYSICNENNLAFHEVLLGLCDNEQLLKTLRCSRERLFNFPWLGIEESARRWESSYWDEHRTIISLYRKGNPREIADFVRYVHWGFERSVEQIKILYHL